MAIGSQQQVGIEMRDTVPEALFALHAGFFFTWRRQHSTQGRNEGHFNDQNTQDAYAGKNTKNANRHDIENHQRQKSCGSDQSGSQHHRADFHNRFDDGQSVCLFGGQIRILPQHVIFFVVALEHLYRVSRADGQNQNRRGHIKNIERHIGQSHQSLTPRDGNNRCQQRQDQPLYRAERFIVNHADNTDCKQQQ